MYKLDWSPFNNNGSRIFKFDKINQHVELYNQAIFQDTIYTTKIENLEEMKFLSEQQQVY
jgi:hypothetical protein